jgi:heparinase II/III-like protein
VRTVSAIVVLCVLAALAAARPAHDDLFARLDLERSGLEAVRDAVQRGDERSVGQALLDYLNGPGAPRWPAEAVAAPGEQVLGRAQAILAHDLTLLNRRAHFGERIDWHANPVGDREWTWALNRHEFFDDLTAAYRQTKDERYARELDALIADWVRANPVPDRPANDSDTWRTSDAGARVSGPWLRAWEALRASPSFRPETQLAMLRSFADHADYLQRFPSERHARLVEANGLAHVGGSFPLFKDAAMWRRTAAERLEAEMARQVDPDGGQFERSTQLQQVAIRSFVEPLRPMGIDPQIRFSDAYLEAVRRMLRWNLALARPDETLPQLGNADRTAVTRRPAFVEALADIPEPRLQSVLARWRALDFADASVALPSSGLYVMRGTAPGEAPSQARYLCIDAGPPGAGAAPDQWGLDLAAYGRSLMLEPGRYLATEAGAWFRSPEAHNSVLVDGQGPGPTGSPGRPPLKGEETTAPSAIRWSSGPGADLFEATYDRGYGPTNDRSVKHQRQVLFVKPAYWVVWDLLTTDQGAPRAHRFEQLWHFPPGRVAVEADRRLAATADEARANLALLPVESDATLRVVEASPGGAERLQGWISPQYGLREAAPVAVYRRDAPPPVLFETVLYPYAAGRRPAFAAERLPVSSGGEPLAVYQVSAFRWHYGRFVDLILMTHDLRQAAALKQVGDLRTDASALVLRLDTTGKPVRLDAYDVSTAIYSGRTLMAEEKRKAEVGLTFEE